jgi:hypothetical protein
LFISGQTRINNYIDKLKSELQKFYVSAHKSSNEIKVLYNKSTIRIVMGSNTLVENTHPHTDIEVVNSNENSAQGTISIFNNRVGGNDLEDFTNMDEEDFSDVD